jgi:putative transposase
MERWVQTCRYELLDHTLIWNQRHLAHARHEYEWFCNSHRPTRQWRTPGHYAHLPPPPTDPTRSPVSTSADINAWAGILNEYQDAA